MLLIFMIIISFLISWFCAQEFDSIAVMKGHPAKKYFWWCFWLGIIGWLMVVALPNVGNTAAPKSSTPTYFDDLPEL